MSVIHIKQKLKCCFVKKKYLYKCFSLIFNAELIKNPASEHNFQYKEVCYMYVGFGYFN